MGSKKQMIDRIPLNSPSGSLVYYRSPEAELQTHNYFYPMKLSSLNIQLYDNDSTSLYSCNNGHNYFEFDVNFVVLNSFLLYFLINFLVIYPLIPYILM